MCRFRPWVHGFKVSLGFSALGLKAWGLGFRVVRAESLEMRFRV